MLLENRILVCVGSGGVGKTTISAAIGVRAAQLGRRTLVLTVDPAKRLATAMGLDLAGHDEKSVPLSGEGAGAKAAGSLAAAVIDSKKIFDQFIARHAQNSEIATRIMKNRLYQQLSTTLAGSQEFTALERLLQASESGDYDLVVLDTPPTKHAVDFLTAPQRISALFQDGVTRWFMAPGEAAPGFIASLVSRGTRTVLKSLETLTGAEFIEEMVDFFAALRGVQKVLRDRSDAVRTLLTGANTKFIVVTSFDAAKLAEARYLQGELTKLGYQMRGVVINRAFPIGLVEDISLVAPAGTDQNSYDRVLDFYKRFKEFYRMRYTLYDDFAAGLDRSATIVRVPEYQRDIYGLADLEALAKVLG